MPVQCGCAKVWQLSHRRQRLCMPPAAAFRQKATQVCRGCGECASSSHFDRSSWHVPSRGLVRSQFERCGAWPSAKEACCCFGAHEARGGQEGPGRAATLHPARNTACCGRCGISHPIQPRHRIPYSSRQWQVTADAHERSQPFARRLRCISFAPRSQPPPRAPRPGHPLVHRSLPLMRHGSLHRVWRAAILLHAPLVQAHRGPGEGHRLRGHAGRQLRPRARGAALLRSRRPPWPRAGHHLHPGHAPVARQP